MKAVFTHLYVFFYLAFKYVKYHYSTEFKTAVTAFKDVGYKGVRLEQKIGQLYGSMMIYYLDVLIKRDLSYLSKTSLKAIQSDFRKTFDLQEQTS